MTHDHGSETSLFATNAAASGWWLVDLLVRHGPSWQIVPPILIGTASLLGAAKGYLNDRQARRHAEERHRLDIELRRRSPSQ
jgi:hypothetical protein